MIKKIAVLILYMLLLSPLTVFSAGEQEHVALKAYSDALSKGDLAQLSSLLGPDFAYHYYKNGKRKIISRNEELKSLGQLFKDTAANSFNEPDLFNQDKKTPSKFHIKFLIIFQDSPKVHTESLFRGAVLDIDETLIVTVEGSKIAKIVEAKEMRRKNKLSFGYLKSIHLGNTEVKDREIKDGSIFELLDKNSHELLLIKKALVIQHEYVREIYYWPNNQIIENF
jgi:hypothetical protein